MKDFIWFLKKAFVITHEIWTIRHSKDTCIFVSGFDNKKEYTTFKKGFMRFIKRTIKDEVTVIRNVK